jgi:hypothetical protein
MEKQTMPRPKRNSKILDEAFARINGMNTIDKDLDLGGDLTLAKFKQAANKYSTDLDAYNQTLSQLDQQSNDLNTDEKALSDYAERMLAAVGARWGKNSNEYEQAGGTRKDERKRKHASKKAQPAKP